MSAPSTPSQGRVAGKVALVTGAASGIGRATALLLAEHGAAVFCADVNPTDEVVAAIIGRGGPAWPCRLDVTSEADWQRVMEHVAEVRGLLKDLRAIARLMENMYALSTTGVWSLKSEAEMAELRDREEKKRRNR